MKISVIVPCHNAEKYINRSFDSLINQTFSDFEIIAVNNGSNDKTQDILEEYAKKYDFISVINEKVGDVSLARNIGLDHAKGDYIVFMDADDYMSSTFLEKLYEKVTSDNFDFVACDVNIVYPKKEVIISSGINDTTSLEEIKRAMIFSYSSGVVWNKIYKRELLNDLRFKENVWYEDVHFNFRLFPKVKHIGSVNEPLINYVQNTGSITYTYNEKLYDLLDNFNDLIDYYNKNNLDKEYYQELEYSYVRYCYNTFIKRLAKCGDFSKFMSGVKDVKKLVKTNFPKYCKNKYIIKPRNLTSVFNSIYFIFFNRVFATIIYIINIGKMN